MVYFVISSFCEKENSSYAKGFHMYER